MLHYVSIQCISDVVECWMKKKFKAKCFEKLEIFRNLRILCDTNLRQK